MSTLPEMCGAPHPAPSLLGTCAPRAVRVRPWGRLDTRPLMPTLARPVTQDADEALVTGIIENDIPHPPSHDKFRSRCSPYPVYAARLSPIRREPQTQTLKSVSRDRTLSLAYRPARPGVRRGENKNGLVSLPCLVELARFAFEACHLGGAKDRALVGGGAKRDVALV